LGLFGLLGKVIGFSIWFIRHVGPWIWKVVGAAFNSMGVALIGIGKGVVQNSRELAEIWKEEFFNNNRNFPTRYDYIVRFIFLAAAFVTHVIGWIILAHLTVWILRVVF
jgi:hypothetical protein